MTDKIKRTSADKGKFITQNVDTEIRIVDSDTLASRDFQLTNLETENTKFGKVDIATATVVPTSNDYYVPEFDDLVEIYINDKQVYDGYVGEVKSEKNATYKLKCFNAIRRLKTTAVNIGTEEDFVLATKILENTVLPKANIYDYNINVDAESIETVDKKSVKQTTPGNVRVQFEANQASALNIIDRLSKYTNSVWWFDGSGTFHFGKPKTDVYKLSYVKETSAGKTTPPYQSVKVIGGGEASQKNWQYSSLLAKNPIVEIRTLKNRKLAREREAIQEEEGEDTELEPKYQDVYEVKKGEIKEPLFVYRDKSIKSGEQASAIANALIDKLIQQTRQGWVDIVGWEDITPFDVIEMPDFMGGEQYMVQGIKHTLDSSNGFKTRVQCGGLVHHGNESVEVGAYG